MMTSKTLIIAAFFAVCSSSCTAQNNDEKNAPLYGKTINIIGDSYVANHRRPKEETWHSMVASKYGMTYRNYGRNGCCIAFNRDKDGFGPSLLEKYKMKCRNFGKENKLLLFDVLDYLVDQGSMNIWKSVSSKKFFTFILDILKTQNDAEIQTKLLQLIQNWGIGFQSKKDVVPNFFKIYNKFKMNGVVFPPKEQPNYYNYISKNNPYPQNYKKENIEENKNRNEDDNEDNFEFEENINDFEYIESIKNKLKISNFESKYRRLVSFLVNMHNNIKTANILIDRRDLSRLKDPINTIKKGR